MKNHSRKFLVVFLIPIILLALVSVPVRAAGGTFKLTPAETSATFNEGTIHNQTITVTSLGFIGRVNVTAQVGPSRGLACILDPDHVTLATTATSTLSCQGNTAGTYQLIIQGSGLVPPSTIDMNQTDPIIYTVTTPLYSASASPAIVNAEAGTTSQTPSVTITIASLGTFSGVVNLNPVSATLSCALNVTSVTVSAGGSSHAGILCGGVNPAINTVTINATSTVNFGSPPKPVVIIHRTSISYSLTGLVCLVDPGFITRTNACPSPAQQLVGMSSSLAGTQLRVSVAVNDSAGLNGFDITLLADHTKLQPVDADLTGSILLTGGVPNVLVKCIGGVRVAGPTCVPTDTADTIHLSAATANFISTTPTNATLFTAVYNILQNITSPTPITFQTGCGTLALPTSIPPLCVIIENGGGQSVPELGPQTISYTTNTATPLFGLKTKPTTLTFTQGTTPPAQTATIYLDEINSFSCGGLGCVDLALITPSPPPSGLAASLVFNTVSDPLITNSSVSVSISRFTPTGIYTIQIVGSVDTTNTPATGFTYLGSTTTLTVVVVAANDFVVTANPTSIFAFTGSSAATTVTVAGGTSFTGTVNLQASINPSTGLTCGFTPSSVVIPPSRGTSQLSCTSSTGGNFTITVTATSGALSHTATLIFGGIDFGISANPSPLVVNPGQTGSTTIRLSSINHYSGVINLSATVSPTGPTLSFSSTTVTVIRDGSATSTLSVTLPSGTSANSTVTVTASDGTITHMLNIIVTPGLPNIVIVSVSTSIASNSTTIGQSVTVSVTVKNTGVIA